jgi:hypothetical protein
MYQKAGMFGMAANTLIKASPNTQGPSEFGPKGRQVRGFGFLHDGTVDRLFHFHRANVFDLSETEALQMEQFMMAFDTNLAPIVGQQITLTSTSPASVGNRIGLLIARANLNECELVVKGNLGGVPRGWLWLPPPTSMFKSDKASEGLISDASLRAQAAPPPVGTADERTYTCVPPTEGQRVGINRDLDGCLDADDPAPDDPAICGIVGTTTTTTTITASSTTTTTNPNSCTNVPVLDPKATVSVNARHEAGRLSARMVIDLFAYAGEAVTVSLSDTDTPTIASQNVGALPALGSSGKKFQFRTIADGVQKVGLKNLAPRQPGKFKLAVKARHWFSAAAANQSVPANTSLTVRIGNRCYTHVATRKID